VKFKHPADIRKGLPTLCCSPNLTMYLWPFRRRKKSIITQFG